MGEVLDMSQVVSCVLAMRRARIALRSDGVVVLPTDSVYGIACAAYENNPAYERIFEIKQRDRSQTLPVLVGSIAELSRLGSDVSAEAQALAEALWPGALTLVVRASEALPAEYVREDGTIAVRMPASRVVVGLCRELGMPLATTSANIHGEPAATSASELDHRVVAEADLTLDGGAATLGVASTIVDCTGDVPRIVRHGAIPDEAIEEAIHGARASVLPC